jgi:hypothetical protein
LIALLSHVTVLWETFYCALVWPKRTRPIVLLIAVGIHGGIGLFLGMWTFGLAMLIANLAFISPEATRGFVTGVLRRRTGIGGGAGRLEEEVSTPTENVAVRRKQRKRSRNQAV